MKLSEDLAKLRCERPDEWTMDRFIKRAARLEEYLEEIAGYSCDCQECARRASRFAVFWAARTLHRYNYDWRLVQDPQRQGWISVDPD